MLFDYRDLEKAQQNVTFNYATLWQFIEKAETQGCANACLIPDKAQNMFWCLP